MSLEVTEADLQALERVPEVLPLVQRQALARTALEEALQLGVPPQDLELAIAVAQALHLHPLQAVVPLAPARSPAEQPQPPEP